MNNYEQSDVDLRTTPTGGVPGEHSPYYRRLLSSGYKGYLQGTLSGAGYYGLIGLAIGAVVGIAAAPFTGGTSLWLIPAVAGAGVLKGAHTFGNIGSIAAINAESADLAEQRRYLLDEYRRLPTGPTGDREAAVIRQELVSQTHSEEPRQFFHWKTVLICAAIGALAGLAFTTPFGLTLLGEIGSLGAAMNAAGMPGLLAIGSALGALAGATIGIDRHYVRRWFDHSENLLQDDSHAIEGLQARAQQVARIRAAAYADQQMQMAMASAVPDTAIRPIAPAPVEAATPNYHSVASLDLPDTKIQGPVAMKDRLAEIQHAMSVPVV